MAEPTPRTAGDALKDVRAELEKAETEIRELKGQRSKLRRAFQEARLRRANLQGQLLILSQISDPNPATIEHGSEES